MPYKDANLLKIGINACLFFVIDVLGLDLLKVLVGLFSIVTIASDFKGKILTSKSLCLLLISIVA
jgi:hypothetical protein